MPKLRRILAAVEILFSFPPHRFSKMCEPSNRRVQAHQGKKLAKYFPLSAFQCGKQTWETDILFLCYFLPFLVCRNKSRNLGPKREVRQRHRHVCTCGCTHSHRHVCMYVYVYTERERERERENPLRDPEIQSYILLLLAPCSLIVLCLCSILTRSCWNTIN